MLLGICQKRLNIRATEFNFKAFSKWIYGTSAIAKLKIQLIDLTYHLAGPLSGEADLSPIQPMNNLIRIDLQNLEQINSIGTRVWANYFHQFENAKFEFLNCPDYFLDAASMIDHILGPKNYTQAILSGVMYFGCDGCENEVSKPMDFWQVDTKAKRKSLRYNCPKCENNSLKIYDCAFLHLLEDNGFN